MSEMTKIVVLLVLVIMVSLFSLSCSSKIYVPVTNFEVEKYLGKWYEIARMPNSFEKDLVNVTATYSMREDGKIKVLNSGYKHTATGEYKTAEGKAKFAGDRSKGYLRVSFFWIFYGDYVIVELDKDYRYALVASSGKYLWILAREPKLEKSIVNSLLDKSRSLGFDTDKIYFTPQTL
jgi:apolipoprotein D and lipocalin family protein